ncbi:hypothetical protein BN946_scf184761.g11 [Trametes cinnabarina]|uniref:F-box domain-containing protein n=1 Tax=Pycnoporus cinnabarinus TaxID=5643 RepID=A0A060SE57_PYCCI|nr:hypothetical protein BN946_scf184761.g11 [Trametes cinnabarina]
MEQLFGTALSRTRAAINRQRSLIHRLPVELVVMISRYAIDIPLFHIYDCGSAAVRRLQDCGAPFFQISRTLIPLSHVCQFWRNALLDNPAFWSVIYDYNVDAAYTFLQRSQQVPLIIQFVRKASVTADPLLGVPPYARFFTDHDLQARLREIRWISLPSAIHKVDYLLFPAPRLELLELIYDVRDRDQLYCATPPILFAGQAPQLRHVLLARMGWLPGNRFDSLTCLVLSRMYDIDFFEYTRLLLNCPIIEELVFKEIDATAPVVEHPPIPGLANGQELLPRLRSLTFHIMSMRSHQKTFEDTPPLALSAVAPRATQALTAVRFSYSSTSTRATILATGQGVTIRHISPPTLRTDLRHALLLFAWLAHQLSVFPLDRLRTVRLEVPTVETPRTNTSPVPRTVTPVTVPSLRTRIAQMTGLEEIELVTDNMPEVLLRLASRQSSSSLIPRQDEAPEWRLPLLRITYIRPLHYSAARRPDLTDLFDAVDVLAFDIGPDHPPEAQQATVASLNPLIEVWNERVVITIGSRA